MQTDAELRNRAGKGNDKAKVGGPVEQVRRDFITPPPVADSSKPRTGAVAPTAVDPKETVGLTDIGLVATTR
jgi:hypothetical protein